MLIRCEDCKEKDKDKAAFTPLPSFYWKPGGAVKFWTVFHGHIPNFYTFLCPVCKAAMISGPGRAIEEKWDTMALAQNDLDFFQQHTHGAIHWD